MKRTGIVAVIAGVLVPALAGAHAGNNDPGMVHACVGNVSRVVRSVGVGGSCIASPALVAETPMHWALDATQLAARVTTLEGLVSTLQAQVAALQAGLSSEAAARGVADATLQAQVSTISGTTVPQALLDLANYVSVETGTINDLAGPTSSSPVRTCTSETDWVQRMATLTTRLAASQPRTA